MPQSASRKLYERACRVMPGGNTRTFLYRSPHPTYVARGDGPYLYDVDGRRHLDFENNFTTLIHGHNFAPVRQALEAQICHGLCYAGPTESEVALAELLCGRVDSFEQIRFMNSGTEAVVMAIKAARAFTGRTKIAKCEGAYHGSYDPVEVSLDPNPDNWGEGPPAKVPFNRGVPQSAFEEVVILPFNDLETSQEILAQHASDLAGILIDPIAAKIGLVPIERDYLRLLRKICNAEDILLISDEVLNFRLSFTGAIDQFGVAPDLCVLGKIIGGGLPIGAVAGRKEVMSVFDPRSGRPAVSQSGTYTANPLSMVAGIAAMEALTPSAFHDLNELGAIARRRIGALFEELEVPAQVTGMGSLFRIHYKQGPIRCYRDAYPTVREREAFDRLLGAVRHHGVMLSSSGLGALSTPMTEVHVDQLADALRVGCAAVRCLPSQASAAED